MPTNFPLAANWKPKGSFSGLKLAGSGHHIRHASWTAACLLLGSYTKAEELNGFLEHPPKQPSMCYSLRPVSVPLTMVSQSLWIGGESLIPNPPLSRWLPQKGGSLLTGLFLPPDNVQEAEILLVGCLSFLGKQNIVTLK